MTEMFAELKAPFAPELVSWRAQGLYGSKAMALAYIDARDVMRRLDEVCGPENWTDTYDETARGRLICRLSIRVNDEWIMKSDGAGDTDVEGSKGAISDAFKRAAVKWGIGRYLYEMPTVWAPCEVRENNGKNVWKAWKQPEANAMFARALAGIEEPPEPKESAHSGLKAELRAFSHEMNGCGDWEEWVVLREMENSQRLMRECEEKLPDWFGKLEDAIARLEGKFANEIKDYARV